MSNESDSYSPVHSSVYTGMNAAPSTYACLWCTVSSEKMCFMSDKLKLFIQIQLRRSGHCRRLELSSHSVLITWVVCFLLYTVNLPRQHCTRQTSSPRASVSRKERDSIMLMVRIIARKSTMVQRATTCGNWSRPSTPVVCASRSGKEGAYW